MSTLQNFNMLAGLNGPVSIPGGSPGGGAPASSVSMLNNFLGSHPGALNDPLFGPLFSKLVGSAVAANPMAPGANFSRPTTQWGTPIPQSPAAIGPLSNLAMGIGRGTLNLWPPIASRPVMGGAAGANNIPWLQQQAQMQQQAVRPPWMNTQPIQGSSY